MDIETLSYNEVELTVCPVVTYDESVCNRPLKIMLTREVVGDEYGSWVVFHVGLGCGHTFDDIEQSEKYREYS